ncbi:MAG: prepilin-type N-terminal cleavage/methylation domain-containing protein [Methylacidiphilales bacterium]|nr:prepilin-type N-terminal cleavage/methylation domain-containing protein [Candidatus Methylacidiphilales bacterium]
MRSFCRPNNFPRGFTLLEVLVTLAILLAILMAVFEFTQDIDQGWKSASADPFAEAADAFDSLALNLSQATLNPYQDYADANGAFRTGSNFVPDHLARRSDLDFVCGPSTGTNGLLTTSGRITTGSSVFFLAPQGYSETEGHAGAEELLNAFGYFVEFGDEDDLPSFIPSINCWRWRLKEIRQPAESLQVFALTSSASWIQELIPSSTALPVEAENVIALVVLPERSANDAGPALAPDFRYDSRDTSNPLTLHQLPPRINLALMAIDEPSARILAQRYGSTAPPLVSPALFQQASPTQLASDLASLDQSLTAQKINHRLFQREIMLPPRPGRMASINRNSPLLLLL